MKLSKLYATMALGEDGNILYNSLVLMLVKIIGYGQTSFRMTQ